MCCYYCCLLAKQSPDALQHTVLLGIVRVVLGGDLENSGECLVVLVNQCADFLGDLCCFHVPNMKAKHLSGYTA